LIEETRALSSMKRVYGLDEAADQAGVPADYLRLLVDNGIIAQGDADGFTDGDVRRTASVRTLTDAGVTVEALAAAMSRGAVDLDFLDSAVYERFATVSRETFQEVSSRTGTPVETLMALREVMGSPPPSKSDRVRVNELQVVPFLLAAMTAGIDLGSTERLLRVMGESLRRVVETEAVWYYDGVMAPHIAQGRANPDIEDEQSLALARGLDESMIAIYHAQQAQTWMGNLVRGVGQQLEDAGLHQRVETPPAICFLDITGYTRLTQERGDAAAAELAESLARLVQRTSVQQGGRPIKWLGDGVMFYFTAAGPSVVAALDMVNGVTEAGLPPAHVGIHCGPVHFQQGDYYGQTVNVASRIAEFARPGEVLVSQDIVDATGTQPGVFFNSIGPVELKGVSVAVTLHIATKPA
jgi:adenylate cyclase